MGKRKIEIKKIENAGARQVCFCKRRQGVFKKASELARISGAEIGVMVFSPAGKMFTFGSPSIHTVLQKLEAGHGRGDGNENSLMQQQYQELQKELETQKELREQLLLQMRKHQARADNAMFASLLNAELSNLDLDQLQMLGLQLDLLKSKVLLAAQQQLPPPLQRVAVPVTAPSSSDNSFGYNPPLQAAAVPGASAASSSGPSCSESSFGYTPLLQSTAVPGTTSSSGPCSSDSSFGYTQFLGDTAGPSPSPSSDVLYPQYPAMGTTNAYNHFLGDMVAVTSFSSTPSSPSEMFLASDMGIMDFGTSAYYDGGLALGHCWNESFSSFSDFQEWPSSSSELASASELHELVMS